MPKKSKIQITIESKINELEAELIDNRTKVEHYKDNGLLIVEQLELLKALIDEQKS